jgi:alkylation response protein AidB-like acyl-CoA dehydrogenase
MGMGLRALNRLAGSDILDRAGVRRHVERALFQGTRNGFRGIGAANRTFSAATKLGKPARQAPSSGGGLFDLTPDDEQQMLREAVGDFASQQIRPAALAADNACAAPKELLDQANELGVSMLGIPEELGGVMAEQSSLTSVLVAEALAHGDLGIAFAALAPGAVATALGLWGSADQQAAYLPPFTSEDVPPAALALIEPTPLFNPFKLTSTARRDGDGWVLNGTKTLVRTPRARSCS